MVKEEGTDVWRRFCGLPFLFVCYLLTNPQRSGLLFTAEHLIIFKRTVDFFTLAYVREDSKVENRVVDTSAIIFKIIYLDFFSTFIVIIWCMFFVLTCFYSRSIIFLLAVKFIYIYCPSIF